MPETVSPYIRREPRDLITAEDWNQVQVLIKADVTARLQKAIDEIQLVPRAEDADKLGGKTPEELAKAIIEAAMQEANKRTGYMRIFKSLEPTARDADGEFERANAKVSIVEHGLKDFPVTDVYRLERFPVVCSEDDNRHLEEVLFYLYHSSEKRMKDPTPGGTASVEIEPASGTFRIPFAKMLELYKVEYDDGSSLADLETEFWQAFLATPNDPFDDDDYCHSPWFDRCCGENRPVGTLKRRGDWDEMWFQCRPAKTINAPTPESATAEEERRPVHVRVEQYDFDKLGLMYVVPTGGELKRQPVMVLLKV
jgi:hypothetical protein